MTIVPGQTDARVPARSLAAGAVFFLAVLSCNSPVAPRAGVTLLVTNATCSAGRCDPLEVLAFPTSGPATPGGAWTLDLGTLTTTAACFTLPASATFRVIGVNGNGTADTTSYTWTTARSLALGALPPAQMTPLTDRATTASFVPARAGGWRISLPTDTAVKPSIACTP